MLGTILGQHSVKLSDVELINVNFSLAPSLMSKQVDAVMGAYRNVELNQMAVEGVPGKCFFVEEEGVPVYDELVYVAATTKLDAAERTRFRASSRPQRRPRNISSITRTRVTSCFHPTAPSSRTS